jgi:hypothetical protein
VPNVPASAGGSAPNGVKRNGTTGRCGTGGGSALSTASARGDIMAAVAVLLFVILLALSALQFRGFGKRVHYGS